MREPARTIIYAKGTESPTQSMSNICDSEIIVKVAQIIEE